MKKKIILFLLLLIFVLCTPSLSAWIIASPISDTISKVEDPIHKNPIENSPTAPYICYNEKTGVQYKSIDTACNTASSGDNIIVIPGTDSCNEIDIDYNIIVPSNVSLFLPYLINGSSYTWEATSKEVDDLPTTFIDSKVENVAANRTTLINMKNGADIFVSANANLYIGGQLKQVGVVGKYSEINLDEGSSINCYGSIYCYGYIKENSSSYKNGSQNDYQPYMNNDFDEERFMRIYSGGYLKTIMGIYDSKGAVLITMVTSSSKVFPYNKFDFPNMQTFVQIDYGANFDGVVIIEPVEDDINIETARVISSSNSGSSVFFLSSGNVCIEYCPSDVLYTKNTSVTKIFLNGAVTQGSLNVTVTVRQIPYNINTAEMFLPISHKLNIFINSGGSYYTNYKIKFLPSSLFKINSGGSATINNDVIFYKAENAAHILSYGTNYKDAQLINNGTLTINNSGSIGSTILTEMTDTSAKIIFDCSSDNLMTVCPEYNSEFVDVTIVSEGYFDDETSTTGKSIYQFIAGSTITSSPSGNQCWYGQKDDVRSLNIVVTNTSYKYSVLAYQIFVADDNKGKNSTEITSGVIDEAGSYNIVKNKYFRVAGSRYVSATFDDGTELDANVWYQMTDDRTLTIIPNEGVKINWSSNSISGAGDMRFTFKECNTANGSFYEIGKKKTVDSIVVIKDYYFTISANLGVGTSGIVSVSSIEVTSGPSGLTSLSLNEAYQASMDYNLKFTISTVGGSSGGSCLLPSTLVTLADGTRKEVQYITKDDNLLVFNHETGKLDTAKVLFNDKEVAKLMNVINLSFSDGSEIGVIYEHGFFDLTTMKYEYIDEYNAFEYIGHRFYTESGKEVTLDNVTITEEYTECYSPVTDYHLNYFTEGVLSMPGGIPGLFNIFEYDSNLQYDLDKMQKDIEEYGLLTYEDFSGLIPYEVYLMFPAQYFGVAIGKGILSWEQIAYYVDRYLPLMV